MKVKVEIIWPEPDTPEGLEEALNLLGADRIVLVERYHDYQYRVIYEVNE